MKERRNKAHKVMHIKKRKKYTYVYNENKQSAMPNDTLNTTNLHTILSSSSYSLIMLK